MGILDTIAERQEIDKAQVCSCCDLRLELKEFAGSP